jgi:hypothetical protein
MFLFLPEEMERVVNVQTGINTAADEKACRRRRGGRWVGGREVRRREVVEEKEG